MLVYVHTEANIQEVDYGEYVARKRHEGYNISFGKQWLPKMHSKRKTKNNHNKKRTLVHYSDMTKRAFKTEKKPRHLFNNSRIAHYEWKYCKAQHNVCPNITINASSCPQNL